MSVKKRGLGRGLDALLSSASPATAEGGEEELRELALDRLSPGKHQPRRHFDEAALAQLADSIRAQGVVQPVVVRAAGADRYEIIAGERRWRAARLAGLKTVPAIIKTLDERGAMAVALVENIQRADLNPLEEAEALHKLIKECGLTHDKCAEAVGRSRAQVSNLLRVMELHPEVQHVLRNGAISLGHAKVLLAAPLARQPALAQKVMTLNLSVRQTETLLRERAAPVAKPRHAPGKAEKELAQRIGLPVRVQQSAQGRGKLVIQFKDAGELDRLLRRIH